MSSGNFVLVRYQLDDGNNIAPIRVQPETVNFTVEGTQNSPSTTAANLDFSVYARKPKNRYGVGARTVTISWNGTPPDGYKDENLTIPILTIGVYAGINLGDAGNYLGTACSVVSKTDENRT